MRDSGGTAGAGVNVSTTQTFTITINPVNDVPTFVAGSNQHVSLTTDPQIIVVSGYKSALLIRDILQN